LYVIVAALFGEESSIPGTNPAVETHRISFPTTAVLAHVIATVPCPSDTGMVLIKSVLVGVNSDPVKVPVTAPVVS
jgi:hypothetical protein